MLFGYARVSTVKQKDGYSLDAQRQRLLNAGISEKNIFTDVGSGKNTARKNFQILLSKLREGDELVVCKLDRFGRNTQDLVNLISDLGNEGIYVSVLDGGMNSKDKMSRALMVIGGLFAEMERDLAVERTKEGLAEAVEKGVKLGAPSKSTPEWISKARELNKTNLSAAEAAKALGCSRAHYFKLLKL